MSSKNEEAPKFYAKNSRDVSRIKNIFGGKAGGCSCSFSAVRFLLGLFKLVSLGRSAATLDKPTGTRATKTHITMAVSGCWLLGTFALKIQLLISSLHIFSCVHENPPQIGRTLGAHVCPADSSRQSYVDVHFLQPHHPREFEEHPFPMLDPEMTHIEILLRGTKQNVLWRIIVFMFSLDISSNMKKSDSQERQKGKTKWYYMYLCFPAISLSLAFSVLCTLLWHFT